MNRGTTIKRQYRSFFVVIFGLVGVFVCFLVSSLYFNNRLQELISIQNRALELVGNWNHTENLNQELLITYDLQSCRDDWERSIDSFSTDFQSFIGALAAQKNLNDKPDLQIRVAKISMHWTVVRQRLKEAQLVLDKYLAVENSGGTGNVLVDFGENLTTGHFNPDLLNVLEKLRWTTSLSRYAFKKALVDVTDHATEIIRVEVGRLKTSSLLLSAFILLAAGLFIFFRMVEMARGREAATRHAEELSVKIKERDLAELQLRSEKDKLYALINAIGAGIYVVTPEYDIEFQSDIIERKFPHADGSKCYETYMNSDRPCHFCLSAETIRSREMKQVETVEDDGHYHEFIFSPFIDIDHQTKNIVLVRDITQRKKLEAEATRAGYLSSIGELAAGVAHEINNPINGIISLAEVIQDNTPQEGLVREATERVIREGVRVARIVKNLLSFARDRKEEPDITDVQEMLGDAIALIGKQIRKDGTKLFVNLPPALPKVLIVRQELQQVFLNLLSNSRHALNVKYPGPDMNKMIVIHGSTFTGEDREMVRVTVQDSGVGIKKEALSKVGLAFYSTKPPGEGTGLGLSISRDIVEKAGGNLYISSEPGKYTVVTLELPAIGEKSS